MIYVRRYVISTAFVLLSLLAGAIPIVSMVAIHDAVADATDAVAVVSDDHVAAAAASPDVVHGIASWWQSGALAAPVAAMMFGLLVVLERLSCSRWPRLRWLRLGRLRSYLSMATGGVVVLLPAIADGSVTWGGLSVALLGGLLAFRPGGGELKAAEPCDGVPT